MTITIRSDHPAGWTKVPHTLARDPRLTNGARGLALQLLSHADGYRSDEEFLAQHTADSRNAVRRQLAELREHGYLIRERVRSDDGKVITRSVLYDVPQQRPAEQSPSRQTSASRSDQGRFAKAQPSPHADTRRDGPTSENKNKPQVTPTRRPPARRPDQAEQGIAAGGTVSPDAGAHIEDQGKEQKKISQSAQAREGCRWLQGRYGLTDPEAAAVVEEVRRRAARRIDHLARYLVGMAEGDLADIVAAVMDAIEPAEGLTAEPPPATPGRGPHDRPVAEAIAAANPEARPERTPAQPEPDDLPENVTPMGARRPDCAHGNPGGTNPRTGDGLPACGRCRLHTIACTRPPTTCPTCQAIADARPAERISETA